MTILQHFGFVTTYPIYKKTSMPASIRLYVQKPSVGERNGRVTIIIALSIS